MGDQLKRTVCICMRTRLPEVKVSWSVRSERGCHSAGLRNIQHALDMMISSRSALQSLPSLLGNDLCSSTLTMLIDAAGVGRDVKFPDREALFLLEQSLGRGMMCCC